MFELDTHTLEALWPSLVLIAVMVVALVWGYIKVRKLIREDKRK